jgi:hypothetical protein
MIYRGIKSGLNENPFDARCDQMQWKSDRDPRATVGQKIEEVSAEKNVRGEMARHGDPGAVLSDFSDLQRHLRVGRRC